MCCLRKVFQMWSKELCTQILKNECKKFATLKLFYILVMLHVYVLNVFLFGQRFFVFLNTLLTCHADTEYSTRNSLKTATK